MEVKAKEPSKSREVQVASSPAFVDVVLHSGYKNDQERKLEMSITLAPGKAYTSMYLLFCEIGGVHSMLPCMVAGTSLPCQENNKCPRNWHVVHIVTDGTNINTQLLQ